MVTIDGLVPSTQYSIQVAAVNSNGNVGVFSTALSVQTALGAVSVLQWFWFSDLRFWICNIVLPSAFSFQRRQQYVVVDGASSDTTSVLSGVPQGSVLGLLFLIYINHVSSLTLTDGSKLTMYADDILLYKPIRQPEDYNGLQTDIDAIQDCISANYLTMNPHKCKYLICSRKIHPHLPPSGLLLGGITLEQVESYRYLGVLVSSRLTWSDHIEHVCAKARKLVGTKSKILPTTFGPTDTSHLVLVIVISPGYTVF